MLSTLRVFGVGCLDQVCGLRYSYLSITRNIQWNTANAGCQCTKMLLLTGTYLSKTLLRTSKYLGKTLLLTGTYLSKNV